jgi:hypothetical protein
MTVVFGHSHTGPRSPSPCRSSSSPCMTVVFGHSHTGGGLKSGGVKIRSCMTVVFGHSHTGYSGDAARCFPWSCMTVVFGHSHTGAPGLTPSPRPVFGAFRERSRPRGAGRWCGCAWQWREVTVVSPVRVPRAAPGVSFAAAPLAKATHSRCPYSRFRSCPATPRKTIPAPRASRLLTPSPERKALKTRRSV